MQPSPPITIVGAPYRQAPFKYQGKCLEWIRDRHAADEFVGRFSAFRRKQRG